MYCGRAVQPSGHQEDWRDPPSGHRAMIFTERWQDPRDVAPTFRTFPSRQALWRRAVRPTGRTLSPGAQSVIS
jgi:hypothetical protein